MRQDGESTGVRDGMKDWGKDRDLDQISSRRV